MPHSSGGGSHGGGFHSSSHSSGSRGGSSSPSRPISNRPYAGATRYRYRNRAGHWAYVYYAGSRTKPDLGATIFASVIVTVVALVFLVILLGDAVYSPTPLDPSSYASGDLMIDDRAGLVSDPDALTDAMGTLLDTTGITPGVEVVLDSQWEENYTDLETYALSEYMRLYDDEKHWLFVISYPDDYASTEFVDWSWQGMIGDDCGDAVDGDHEDDMTSAIHTEMLRADPDEVGQALAAAFVSFSESCMEHSFSADAIFFVFIIIVCYAAFMISMISSYKKSTRLYNATPCPVPAPGLKNCEYCGSVYDPATATVCASCGAPIPVEGQNTAK